MMSRSPSGSGYGVSDVDVDLLDTPALSLEDDVVAGSLEETLKKVVPYVAQPPSQASCKPQSGLSSRSGLVIDDDEGGVLATASIEELLLKVDPSGVQSRPRSNPYSKVSSHAPVASEIPDASVASPEHNLIAMSLHTAVHQAAPASTMRVGASSSQKSTASEVDWSEAPSTPHECWLTWEVEEAALQKARPESRSSSVTHDLGCLEAPDSARGWWLSEVLEEQDDMLLPAVASNAWGEEAEKCRASTPHSSPLKQPILTPEAAVSERHSEPCAGSPKSVQAPTSEPRSEPFAASPKSVQAAASERRSASFAASPKSVQSAVSSRHSDFRATKTETEQARILDMLAKAFDEAEDGKSSAPEAERSRVPTPHSLPAEQASGTPKATVSSRRLSSQGSLPKLEEVAVVSQRSEHARVSPKAAELSRWVEQLCGSPKAAGTPGKIRLRPSGQLPRPPMVRWTAAGTPLMWWDAGTPSEVSSASASPRQQIPAPGLRRSSSAVDPRHAAAADRMRRAVPALHLSQMWSGADEDDTYGGSYATTLLGGFGGSTTMSGLWNEEALFGARAADAARPRRVRDAMTLLAVARQPMVPVRPAEAHVRAEPEQPAPPSTAPGSIQSKKGEFSQASPIFGRLGKSLAKGGGRRVATGVAGRRSGGGSLGAGGRKRYIDHLHVHCHEHYYVRRADGSLMEVTAAAAKA